MGWKSIINPWGYNLDLERELAEAEYALEGKRQSNAQLRQYNAEVSAELRVANSAIRAGEETIRRLHKIIGQGHFRNPATGRLGPKGQTYQ